MCKFYKGELYWGVMSYEELLESAYEDVEVSEECERFEVVNVKGHHEGVRTVISNFGKVVACLRRRPEHLLKFLGKELGIQGEIKGERLILSRKLSSKDVNAKIKKYAKLYGIFEDQLNQAGKGIPRYREDMYAVKLSDIFSTVRESARSKKV